MVAITQVLVAGLLTIAVQARPQPQAAQPSLVPTPSASASAPASSADADQAKADAAALAASLITAPSAVQRFQRLLTKAGALLTGEDLKKRVVFNFNNAKATGEGGRVIAANVETFPILTDLGISTTVAFLSKCGINTPHVHPRATEFLTVVNGSISFGYVLENNLVKVGSPEIAGTLNKFEGTVFPQGSIHFQFNNNCEDATFVAALNSEDPGTNQIAQGFFALNDQVVNATLGPKFPKSIDGSNFEHFRTLIPANLAQDMDNCLARCDKKY